MILSQRIEEALRTAVDAACAAPAPPRLAAALDHAVFPGGARIRPTILVAVASACGDDRPEVTDRAAAALELVHCASLVHDDLPAFDDADTRRGKPSVHRAFSEALAVLAGDSLIMQAFETLARLSDADAGRGLRLTRALAHHGGMPLGICAGQGWESEAPEAIDLLAYHRAKTGALFVAATQMGAIAAGHDAEPWTELGDRIGRAFQIADDLRDAVPTKEETGKPSGQDSQHARPNAVAAHGVEAALDELKATLGGAIASIPSCPGEAQLARMVTHQAERITPRLQSVRAV